MKRSGFTLIEVLIAIAIIALLAALLLPVFQKVKAKANQTTAVSNVHQVWIGEQLYMMDNDQSYPMWESVVGRYRYRWPDRVVPYIQRNTPVRGPHGLIYTEDLPKVFFDPNRPFEKQEGLGLIADGYTSWGISEDLEQDLTADNKLQPIQPAHASDVAKPSECVNFVDTCDWIPQVGLPGTALSGSYLISVKVPFPPFAVPMIVNTLDAPFPDGPRVNNDSGPVNRAGYSVTAFCDGHVKPLPAPLLLDSGKYWSVSGTGQYP